MLELELMHTKESSFKDRSGLVYARVSSAKQEREGHGRDSQEARCRKELLSMNVPYEMTFPDTYTGGGDFMNRPAMRALLAHIDAHPHKKYVVIFDDLKRFARDVEFHIKLRTAFRKRDVLLRCLNFNFEDTAEGRFIELIIAGQAELERHQNARQVFEKTKARLDMGYWAFRAKVGYTFEKDSMRGMVCTPNQKGRDILKPALEGFASGDLPRKIDVARYLCERSFWGKDKDPETRLTQVDKLLKDCFYMGDLEFPDWGVARRKGRHEALISASVFANIERRMRKDIVSANIRKDHSKDFPVRGFLSCSCGGHITASWSKGYKKKYAYYFCSNKECTLYKKSIPAKDIEDGFYKIMKQSKLKQNVGKVVEVIFDRVWKQEIASLEKEEKRAIEENKKLDNKIRELTDMVRTADSPNLRRVYEKQIEESLALMFVEQTQCDQILNLDLFTPYRTALLKSISFLKSPYSVWKKLEIEEQQELFFFIFDEKLVYDLKTGYRTDDIPTAARLFEGFVMTNSISVDQVGSNWNTLTMELMSWKILMKRDQYAL